MTIKLKRAYEPPSKDDGERYLVERLWPRGVWKDAASLAAWLKDVAPSTGLRKWYGHDVERWHEFERHYKAELEEPARERDLLELVDSAARGTVTLVFAARDAEHSSARVLKDILEARLASRQT
jgi:uncharacterized protein YeaO (DUF488 family)